MGVFLGGSLFRKFIQFVCSFKFPFVLLLIHIDFKKFKKIKGQNRTWFLASKTSQEIRTGETG